MNIDTLTIKKLAKKLHKPLTIWDLESTGVSTDKDEPVQFAALKILPDGEFFTLKFLCKPSIPIPLEATEIHHITNEMVENEPPLKYYVEEIIAIFDGSDYAGYNIKFDTAMLNYQFKKLDLPSPLVGLQYDAFPVFRRHSPRNLSAAVRFYTSKDMENAHDALSDVLGTAGVILGQLELDNLSLEESAIIEKEKDEKEQFDKYLVKIDNSNEYKINFGNKCRGFPLDRVEKSYLKWMLNGDFPESVKSIIKKYC